MRWLDDLSTAQFVGVTVALAWCVFVVVSVLMAIGWLIRLI
jgi:hypothetical protein